MATRPNARCQETLNVCCRSRLRRAAILAHISSNKPLGGATRQRTPARRPAAAPSAFCFWTEATLVAQIIQHCPRRMSHQLTGYQAAVHWTGRSSAQGGVARECKWWRRVLPRWQPNQACHGPRYRTETQHSGMYIQTNTARYLPFPWTRARVRGRRSDSVKELTACASVGLAKRCGCGVLATAAATMAAQCKRASRSLRTT